jgi:hypothetical protein
MAEVFLRRLSRWQAETQASDFAKLMPTSSDPASPAATPYAGWKRGWRAFRAGSIPHRRSSPESIRN